MAWTRQQTVGGASGTQVGVSGSAGTTTLSITPGVSPLSRSVLVATGSISSPTAGIANVLTSVSVSDSVDGAWTLVAVYTSAAAGTTGGCSFIAYKFAPSSSSARTVTLTVNGAVVTYATTWQLQEYNSGGVALAIDGSATIGTGATTAATSVTVTGPTPSLTNGLAIGMGGNDGGSAWASPTGGIWSTNFSLTGSGAGTDAYCVYGPNPASGSAMSTVFTETGATNQVPSAAVVVFKGASGAGPTGWWPKTIESPGKKPDGPPFPNFVQGVPAPPFIPQRLLIGTVQPTNFHPGPTPGQFEFPAFKQGVLANTPIPQALLIGTVQPTNLHPGKGPKSNTFPNFQQGFSTPALFNTDIGTWSWAGTTSTFSQLFSLDIGAWTWNGTTASFGGAGPTTFNLDIGAWTWAGQNVTTNSLFNLDKGAWTWAGTNATLTQLYSLGVGAWTWAGTSATFNELVNLSPGTWTWAGTTASFSTINTINTDVGAWTWAGTSASLNQLFNTSPGTWTWNGTNAAFSSLLSLTPGVWTWAGTNATFSNLFALTPGVYTWIGVTASIPSQGVITRGNIVKGGIWN